jgi:hypothetical protein
VSGVLTCFPSIIRASQDTSNPLRRSIVTHSWGSVVAWTRRTWLGFHPSGRMRASQLRGWIPSRVSLLAYSEILWEKRAGVAEWETRRSQKRFCSAAHFRRNPGREPAQAPAWRASRPYFSAPRRAETFGPQTPPDAKSLRLQARFSRRFFFRGHTASHVSFPRF